MNQLSLIWNQEPPGSSGDGYIWKYLYTIKPSQAVRFDTTDYIPVPDEWQTNSTDVPLEITHKWSVEDYQDQKQRSWSWNC